jgi:hypothetical protein
VTIRDVTDSLQVQREERRARGEVPPADAEAVARNTFGELPTRGRARARAGVLLTLSLTSALMQHACQPESYCSCPLLESTACSPASLAARAEHAPAADNLRWMAVSGTAARPPRGGLAATRPAQPADVENAAAPSNAGGDLAIFTDPEFGKPWWWWCVTTVMVLLVSSPG